MTNNGFKYDSGLVRVRRKYNLRTVKFIEYIVSSIKRFSKEDLKRMLDEYEQHSVAYPMRWAKTAPIEEIAYVMLKLGVEITITGMSTESPFQSRPMLKSMRGYAKSKNMKAVTDMMIKTNFFALAGRDIMKAASFHSQLLNGQLYIPNRAHSSFIEMGVKNSTHNIYNTDSVDSVILNILSETGTSKLDNTDMSMLFLFRKFDYTPMSIRAVYESMSNIAYLGECRKKIRKLERFGYLMKIHSKSGIPLFQLTSMAWLLITETRKNYFKDIKFWSPELMIETANSNENGSSKTNRQDEEKIA